MLSSICSTLFGFQRLHEDGARTKALLLKVRVYDTDGALDRHITLLII